jgi:hypothetical protein
MSLINPPPQIKRSDPPPAEPDAADDGYADIPTDDTMLTAAERARGYTGRPAVEPYTPDDALLHACMVERHERTAAGRTPAPSAAPQARPAGTGGAALPPPPPPPPQTTAGSADQFQSSVEIIREYLTERYQPVYRDGTSIRCRDGSLVPMRTACAVPTTALINRLSTATDAPKVSKSREVNRDALPGHFRLWGPVAWGDLIDSLPDEDRADLGDLGEPQEEMRRLVRAAMLTQITLGSAIGDDPYRVERRSLIEWCDKFKKRGPWKAIRSYKCWCREVEIGGGELVLRVAIRHELFAQVSADRRLIEMGQKKFTVRAKRYGIGASSRDERPHGVAAIVLDRQFVSDLLTDPTTENADACEVG